MIQFKNDQEHEYRGNLRAAKKQREFSRSFYSICYCRMQPMQPGAMCFSLHGCQAKNFSAKWPFLWKLNFLFSDVLTKRFVVLREWGRKIVKPIILIKFTNFRRLSLSTTKRFVTTSENKKINSYENGHLAEKISAWQPWREKPKSTWRRAASAACGSSKWNRKI